MGSFGGYFKGEKKKKKKGEGSNNSGGFAPVFTPPQIIGKNREKS